ncbi:MAG: hypothetical protein RLZZ623_582, partial [Actinomycetota bacterium]
MTAPTVRRPLHRWAPDPELRRRLAAEALGTGFLIVAVVGSGIMASRLST